MFDFDDTLAPDTTSALLRHHGIDADDFWKQRASALIARGYDQPYAYLNLILDEVRNGKMAGLTNQQLTDFGATLDSTWFPGLPELFDDLRATARSLRDITLEFYVISGGLQALIEGSSHVKNYFNGVYGCQFGEDESGVITNIKRAVTFTEKTRYLFEINKGITAAAAAKNPFLVNKFVAQEDRTVPWENMIYVGDGLTDIPCFSVVKLGHGTALGVLKPGSDSAKQAFQELLKPERVVSVNSPLYRQGDDLGELLRAAVSTTCGRIAVSRAGAV